VYIWLTLPEQKRVHILPRLHRKGVVSTQLATNALIYYTLCFEKAALQYGSTLRRSIFLPRLGTYTCDRAHANTARGNTEARTTCARPLASHVTLTPPIRILYLSVPARESWYKIQYVRMHLPIFFSTVRTAAVCNSVINCYAYLCYRPSHSHSPSLGSRSLFRKNQGLLISSLAATHPKR
jgi:hypothetical protein